MPKSAADTTEGSVPKSAADTAEGSVSKSVADTTEGRLGVRAGAVRPGPAEPAP